MDQYYAEFIASLGIWYVYCSSSSQAVAYFEESRLVEEYLDFKNNQVPMDIKKAIEEYVERKMPLPHDVTGVNLNWPYAMLCDNGVLYTATVTLEEKIS